MTTDVEPIPAEVVDERRRKAALLKALGMERQAPEQVELFLAIAKRYDLDPMLKHLVMVEGRPYITRDGLLWIAHRSGVLDGIEVTEPVIATLAGVGEFWTAKATVWRRDMTRPFTYGGRYPTKGPNQRYGPEMAVKTAESMALRRAFNVSAPTVDERWDLPTVQADVDAVSVPQQPPQTLAERVAERRPTAPAEIPPPVPTVREQVEDLISGLEDELACGDEDVSPMALGFCELPPGHKGAHKSENGTWPR